MLLKYVVASFNHNNNQTPNAQILKQQYFFTTGLCLSAFVWILVHYPPLFGIMHMGMKCRIGISSMIYRKVISKQSNIELKLDKCTY